jgi:hypothetical protein
MSVAGPVAAQETETIVSQQVKPVYVRSIDRGESHGQLLRLGPNTLTLLEDGNQRDIPWAEITRIDAPGDSVKNGAIIGALVLGGWCALVCRLGVGDFGDGGGAYTSLLVINVGFGALIGAGIDAMHVGRTTIYQDGSATTARRMSKAKPSLSFGFKF